jgi:hypothetical protein
MDRREMALWMREVIDHLSRGCDQWQFAGETSEQFALQSMERDLAELQRIVRTARRLEVAPVRHARAA